MNPALQNFLAFLVGMATSSLFVAAIESVGHRLFPIVDVDMKNPEQLKRAIKDLPLGAFLMVELAYFVGSLAGGYGVAYVAASHAVGIAIALGVLLTLFGVQNLVAIPHPTWFAVLSSVTFVPMCWLGCWLGVKGQVGYAGL